MCLSPGKQVLQATALITTVKFLVFNYLNHCSAKKGRIKTILYPPYSNELEEWHSNTDIDANILIHINLL